MRKSYVKKIVTMVTVVVLACVLLSGCMNVTAEDLYALPLLSEGYIRLQAMINDILNQGAELSPPTGGINRQAVQLRDLTNNGINEVIAFFSVPGSGTLKVYIFTMEDGDYTIAETIEVIGTSFESVRYADMDGDGYMEIIIGWQMGPALSQMEIFSIRDFHAVSLARVEYTEFIDFDMTGNGNSDVVVIRPPTHESGIAVLVYSLMPDGELIVNTARLSNGVEIVSRVLTGTLIDNTPALFVDSEGRFRDGNRLVTDVYIFRYNELINLTVKSASGVSDETVRTRMLSSDINRDGLIKIPIPRALKTQTETQYYAIDWYTFNRRGYSNLSLTTFHNNNDEWLLILPFDWRGRVSVRRQDDVAGERTVVFSFVHRDDELLDFLKVYKITGDLREYRARLPGRFTLLESGSAVYAFELLSPPNSFGLSFDEALIKDNFRLLFLD